jgi:peptidoglycan/xylan/chitin deacetylase (PgdA/CDA1 family)
MNLFKLREKVQVNYRATLSRLFFKRPLKMQNSVPYISFTFDDFPRSALLAGGRILNNYGVAGTYFASLGLVGQFTPVGQIFIPEDLEVLCDQGHELGCHTYGHLDPWKAKPVLFEDSIIRNKLALTGLLPGFEFKSFSYPLQYPRPATKRRAGKHFICCRCGGQKNNAGVADFNLLNAFFLERSGGRIAAVQKLIEQNVQDRGWLIFATHDISATPTPYGCAPAFFDEIVKYSVSVGARILPVFQACQEICSRHRSNGFD